MNLNKYDEFVIYQKRIPRKHRFSQILCACLALFCVIAVTGCKPAPVPTTSTPPPVTAQSTGRTDAHAIRIPYDVPLSEDAARDAARQLETPIEAYDLIRPGGPTDTSQLESAVIERVVDGDTFIIDWHGESTRLRLIGLDAPESFAHHDARKHTVEGESVSRVVKAWLTGRSIFLEFDPAGQTDPYDRLLAYVWLDDHTMVNEVLVREGLARERRYKPTVKWNDYFEILEQKAQHGWCGLWGRPPA
jgi:micrococcal nuclease